MPVPTLSLHRCPDSIDRSQGEFRTPANHPHLLIKPPSFKCRRRASPRAKAPPRTRKRLCVYRVWSVVRALGLMCTHNGPQHPVSHSNPDRKRGVSECALEGRAAVLLVERPCGISCRFSLFFYIHVCAEQLERVPNYRARESAPRLLRDCERCDYELCSREKKERRSSHPELGGRT